MQLQLLQSLGWALLNSFWQLGIIWILFQVLSGTCSTSRQRSLLAITLLFSGFAWFIATIFFVYISLASGNGASSLFLNTATAGFLQPQLPTLSVAYLLLLIIPVLRFLKNYRYVNVIRKYGLNKIGPGWRLFTDKTAIQMGIRRKVNIWISDLVNSPVTIGFFKPVILVPAAAILHLSPAQLESVLLHELAHIKRHDYLLNVLVKMIEALLYFNPFVKAMVKVIDKEREQSCDEWVLQFQYNAHEYASALLILEQKVTSRPAFLLAASGKEGELLRRIKLILGAPVKKQVDFRNLSGRLFLLLAGIAVNISLFIPGAGTGMKAGTTPAPGSAFIAYSGTPEKNTNEQEQDIYTPPVMNATTGTEERDANQPEGVNTLNPYRLAGFEQQTIPELKQYQEAQVKEALAASKRVLENEQWKSVERSIADAFTENEKKEIREVYDRSLNKVDWNRLENRLKLAYNQIDWDNVNEQLNTAINQIRVDSLQRVYNDLAIRLNEVQKELNANKIKYIPDTDISVQTIAEKKQKVQESMRKLDAIRTKKIVRL